MSRITVGLLFGVPQFISTFLFAFVGAITSKEYNKAKWAEMGVPPLTCVGAEKTTMH